MTARRENDEIDLLTLIKVLWSKALLLVLVALIAGAAAFAGTIAAKRLRLEPTMYTATVSMYVDNNKSYFTDTESVSISSPELTASSSLVETYIFILESRTTLEEVIAAADLPYSYEELLGMVSAEAVEDTAAFIVTVESENPAEAELIANTIAEVMPDRIAGFAGSSSVHIVDYAVNPAQRAATTPNIIKNTLIGALVGLFAGVAVVTVKFILSDVIMSVDDLRLRYPEIPVLAPIPDIPRSEKKGYYYSSYYGGEGNDVLTDEKKAPNAPAQQKVCGQACENLSFAAKEAFRRLRTNVMVSFGETDAGCRVIGVTSAQPGEGKSTVALNLAWSLAELGKRVLLIDADMRRPAIHTMLGRKPSPGLSNLLGDINSISSAIRKYSSSTGDTTFDVITAGEVSYNSSALLSSAQMERLSAALRPEYDYIVLDTSSVGAVIDAVPAAQQADGMIVVVRENSCHGGVLRDCVDQLEFAHVNVLGFAVNGVLEGMGKKYRYTPRA